MTYDKAPLNPFPHSRKRGALGSKPRISKKTMEVKVKEEAKVKSEKKIELPPGPRFIRARCSLTKKRIPYVELWCSPGPNRWQKLASMSTATWSSAEAAHAETTKIVAKICGTQGGLSKADIAAAFSVLRRQAK